MKCRCGGKPVFFRKHEGTHLCRDCFICSVESKFRRNIRKDSPLKKGDRVAVALSGGKDSSVALQLMSELVKPRKDVEVFAISVDEGIKGYRDESLEIARRLCKKLGMEHHVFSFIKEFGKSLDDVGGESRCTHCGVGRRWVLNRAARELGATRLCTGHNLDDEVQGIIMDYMSGDLAKLSRMGSANNKARNPLFVPRMKPLRNIPEREVALYALLKGLELHETECPHAGGLRFSIRDFLNTVEAVHSGTKFSILETFEKIQPSVEETVKKRSGAKISRCSLCGEPCSAEKCKTCELWGLPG